MTSPTAQLAVAHGVDPGWTAMIGAAVGNAMSAAGGAVNTGVGVVDGVSSAATGAVRAGAWLANPHSWVRIAYVVMGLVLVAVGAGMATGMSTSGVKGAALAAATRGVVS